MGEVLNVTTNIFTNSQYHCWYKESRDQFCQYLLKLQMKMLMFKFNLKESFLEVEQLKKLNHNELCYQFSKHGPYFFLWNLSIRDIKNELPPPEK